MTGLYVHIPFCRQKCFYCDFFSQKYDSVTADRYLDALTKQADIYKGFSVETIYIGGGTPSVLSLWQMQKLLQTVTKKFDLSGLKEFTAEVNPESVSAEKFTLLKEYGVGRLSIGLQSPNDAELKYLGRVHDFSVFCEAFESAKKAGFENINIDLIYGLPGQTLDGWKHILEKTVSFESAHLSLYPLSVEKDTVFGKNAVKTNDDMQRNMYEAAVEMLSKHGFRHYEISNWAKPSKEAVHNSNYWRNQEYIALGAGAAGYFDRLRYKIIENTGEYIIKMENGLDVKTESGYVDDKCFETETVMLGLRLLEEGVSVDCFKSLNNKTVLKELLNQGMLVKDGDKIKIHKDYVFVSNAVISEFMGN